MPKSSLKNLLLSLCALLFISCSTPPAYSRQDIAEAIKKICKAEYNIEVNTWLFGETLWVHAPVKLFDEKGKFKISDEGKADEDLSESLRKISQAIQRALLNMDDPPLFYCFVKSDLQRLGKVDLIRMNQYELVFIPDQIRLTLGSYGLGANVSTYEFEKRIIAFQIPFIATKMLKDNYGLRIRKYNISTAEFISLLIQQAIFKTFRSPEFNDNFEVNEVAVNYRNTRLTVNFNIRIKKYKKGIPIPFKKVEEIINEAVNNYSVFLEIKRAAIYDELNQKSKTISFKSFTNKSEPASFSKLGLDNPQTLLKLYRANFYLTQAYYYSQGKKKNFAKAILYCRKTLEVAPDYLYPRILLGENYLNSGQYQQALSAFNESRKIDPRNPTVHFYLGETYRYLNEPEKALKSFKLAFLIQPDYPGVIEALSSIYAELGIPDEAVQYLEQAVENAKTSNSENPEVYRSIGNTYTQLGRYQEALGYFQKAKQLKPNNFLTYISLGDAYRLLGKSQEAIDNFQKALILKPDSIPAELGLAHTYLALGQYDRAIAKYEDVLEAIPQSPDVYVALSRAHNELGLKHRDKSQQHRALSYLKKALRLDPENFQAHYSLGETYSNLGQYKLAVQHFKQALRRNSYSPELYFGLARAYSFLGKNQKAKENFQRAHDLFYRYGDYLNAQKAEENLRNIP